MTENSYLCELPSAYGWKKRGGLLHSITILLRMVLVSPLRYCAVIVIWFSPDLASGDVKCRKIPSAEMEKTCSLLTITEEPGSARPTTSTTRPCWMILLIS